MEEIQCNETCYTARFRKVTIISLAILSLSPRSVSNLLRIQPIHSKMTILGAYSVLKAKLNNAHRALAAFSQESIRNQISPGSKFTLITQNIDSLSPAANKELARFLPADNLESVDVIEMHGRLFDVLCNSTDCDHVEFNTDSPICGALAGTENLIDKKIMDPIVDLKDLPRCSKCNSLARPGVVWFGEIPHRLDEIDGLVEEADLCLVIGTSAVVRYHHSDRAAFH